MLKNFCYWPHKLDMEDIGRLSDLCTVVNKSGETDDRISTLVLFCSRLGTNIMLQEGED